MPATPSDVSLFDRMLNAFRVAHGEVPSASELAALSLVQLDLATLVTGGGTVQPVPWNGRAYGLVFPVEGNPRGARIRVDLGGGMNVVLVPGDSVRMPLDRLTFYRAGNSTRAGLVKLYLVLRPDVSVNLDPSPGFVDNRRVCNGYNEVTGPVVQQVRAAAPFGANAPGGTGDGLTLEGVKALRLYINCNGTTFKTGLGEGIRPWLYFGTTSGGEHNGWYPCEEVLPFTLPDATHAKWVSPDLERFVRSGADRVYFEVFNLDTTDGATDFNVWLQRFGHLYPLDLSTPPPP